MKAMCVLTSFGERLFTEATKKRCCSGDEVASFEMEVPDGTCCSICEEEITE